jgi:phage gpG-like protein
VRVRFRSAVNPRLGTVADVARLDMRDMATMTAQVDTRFTAHERTLFASEGASGGPRWPALSPAYAKAKRRRFPGRKIMTRTGELRNSLTRKADPKHVAYSTLRPRAQIHVGTSDAKAAYHVGPLKNPLLPERDTLQHTAQQGAAYMVLVQAHLGRKLAQVARALSRWSRR